MRCRRRSSGPGSTAAGKPIRIPIRVGPPVRHDRALTSSVSNLRVFGSVARGEDRPDSDVDLLADLPAHMGLFGLGRVQAELEAILDARVDLVPAGALKPNVRSRAERELVAL